MKVHLNWTYLKYQSQVAVNMFSLWQTYSIVITCKSTVPVPVAEKDIILEPVFRCLYSIVLIFCNKDI